MSTKIKPNNGGVVAGSIVTFNKNRETIKGIVSAATSTHNKYEVTYIDNNNMSTILLPHESINDTKTLIEASTLLNKDILHDSLTFIRDNDLPEVNGGYRAKSIRRRNKTNRRKTRRGKTRRRKTRRRKTRRNKH